MSLPAVIFFVLVYGGLIIVGGMMWIIGRFLHHDRIAKLGEAMAFLGLCVDGVLLIYHWMFGWMPAL